jgi:hypothetical protein
MDAEKLKNDAQAEIDKELADYIRGQFKKKIGEIKHCKDNVKRAKDRLAEAEQEMAEFKEAVDKGEVEKSSGPSLTVHYDTPRYLTWSINQDSTGWISADKS